MQSVSANKLFLQSENKNNLEDQLLFDAVMTNADVHTLTVDDVDAVCSHSIYTGPQLTDSLGAQYACLPVCTTTTTTAATTTQPGQPPLLMVNDTQPPLPHHHYSQPAPALTTAHQPDISVHQPDISVHQLVAGLHQQSAAMLCTQPSTTWSLHTQLTHLKPLTAWTATALSPGTQLPRPSVSTSAVGTTALSDTAQSVWMSPVGVSPAQPGPLSSLDARPACTQPPLPQPLHCLLYTSPSPRD